MRYLLLLFILFFSFGSKGQELLSEMNLRDARAMSTDEIGNIYVVYEDNSLVQYNERGDSLTNFRNIQNGILGHIDTRNPLKLLLFYPDFSKIIILDRMLSLKNEIDLRQLNIFRVGAAGLAMDGNIWVYDLNNVQLLKIDDNLNIVNKSDDLRSAIQSFPDPISLEESERKVYLLDATKGIYVFDQFANFLNNIELFHVKQLQVYNSLLVYVSGDSLLNYNPITAASQSLPLLKTDDFISARIDRGKLYLLSKNKLRIYNLAP